MHAVAEGQVRERDVHGRDGATRTLVDRRGETETDRGDLCVDQLADRRLELPEQRVL